MITISKDLMEKTIKLSAEWGNTGFIVINNDDGLAATVWNHWKWEEPQRKVIAYVNSNDGFVIEEPFIQEYKFETDPNTLI